MRHILNTRFADFRAKKHLYSLFADPFGADVDNLLSEFQVEVIDIQSSSELKAVIDSQTCQFSIGH